MADKNPAGGGFPLSINTILALLTLVGSAWFVSQRLTSDRPVAQSGGALPFVGEQNLEARLWEDPFKGDEAHRAPASGQSNFDALVEQIRERARNENRVHLLPVMISGGHYSEDKESRIRSRFAIVSALSRAGYAPEDAEHLGELNIPWPTQLEVVRTKRADYCQSSLWVSQATNGPRPLNIQTSFRMDVHYEWYRRRTFIPNSAKAEAAPSNVLVLWLDDSFFEDEPLVRLALLLQPLWLPDEAMKISLIGPRRSSTLRAMLPGELAGKSPYWEGGSGVWPLVADALRHVELFCATPSVMDEVLVTQWDPTPRKAVAAAMKANGFKAFHNFAATDAQFAAELLDELKLRNVDLTKSTQNHLVLISEWDTFYARMLSLTYATEMRVRQSDPKIGPLKETRRHLVDEHEPPSNFHSLRYLRGLDGQTVGGKAESKPDRDSPKGPTTSFDELRNWAPDANKAEGQAQFDYLARLGDQLDEIEEEVRRGNRRAKIVVGIVGSDVYDTLLILQALRPRFPNCLFFTTDLDARFWHPRELSWSRNLIVISGYGLSLHEQLQGGIAPFRDSIQTSQFAATLAALGNTSLLGLKTIPPRRFEIGNNGPVNLSVEPGHLVKTHLAKSSFHGGRPSEAWLHPMTTAESHATDLPMSWKRPFQLAGRILWRSEKPEASTPYDSALLALLGLGLLLALACGYWQPLRTRILAIPGCLARVVSWSRPEPPIGDRLDLKLQSIHGVRLVAFWVGLAGVLVMVWLLGSDIWHDTLRNPRGEPFSLTNGISAWPAIILRLAAMLLSVLCCFTLHSRLAIAFYELTKTYRLPFKTTAIRSFQKNRSDLARRLPWILRPFRELDSEETPRAVRAQNLWRRYYLGSHWIGRLVRVSIACAIYYMLSRVIFQLFGTPSSPLRGDVIQNWVKLELGVGPISLTVGWHMLVNIAFFFLTFLTIDAARLCHRFVEKISAGNVRFPDATRHHFQTQRGQVSVEYLDEWIGTHLIADLTERVGKLLWFPSLVLLLLLTARLPWWDRWPWHTAHIIMMVLNICLVLTSVMILQSAARRAKRSAEERLLEKIARLRAKTAPTPAHNDAVQAEKLLEEIRNIHHGAFVPFWENPVLGALLIGPGGLTILQMVVWSMTK